MYTLKQYLVDEFVEEYLESRMTRRDALRRLAALTGSMTSASAILVACGTPPAPPQAAATAAPTATAAPAPTPAGPGVSATDPDIVAEAVQFPGQSATLLGYLARPRGNGPFPAALVCHENRGVNEHIRDVTRRLAKAGYVGLAVDLLSREGGTEKITDPAQVPGILGNTPPDRFIQDFKSGATHLQTLPYVRRDRLGMVGFCFGGGVTWRVATQMPELRAAVPFYGPNPPLEDVPNIRAAVLGIYGERDTRITQGSEAMEKAMKESNKTFEKIIYPNAAHAFHNDTGQAYNPEAARDAWAKTLAWFERHLKS
ncbi:MAG: dienelactone hydrolase family protein [Chloroflexi bacterium]|nr:dienelactone hydrolase family protein [Chloroflexota bacterium]